MWTQIVGKIRLAHAPLVSHPRFPVELRRQGQPGPFLLGRNESRLHAVLGRPAPAHPGGAPNCGDWELVQGYSRELSSAGFWPGGADEGAFYSYAYPEPDGFADCPVAPAEASYSVSSSSPRRSVNRRLSE